MARNLDVSLLRAFVAVVDAGGMTAATGVLNLTQAAVSQQIKRLEETLGEELITRDRRGMKLTTAGERLFGRAKRMLALNDEIWTEMTTPDLRGRGAARHPERHHHHLSADLPEGLRAPLSAGADLAQQRLQRIAALEALWRQGRRGARHRDGLRCRTARTSSWTVSSGSAPAAARRRGSVRCRSPSAAPTAPSARRSARRCRRPASSGARSPRSRTRRRRWRRLPPTSP